MTAESHRVLREQLGAYALGQLSGERWRAVHAHLEVCAACRADLDEIAPVAGLLGAARDRLRPDELDESEPEPPPLSPALLEQVRAGAPPAAQPSPPRRRWVPAAGAAAVIGLLAAGGVGFALGSAGEPGVPTEPVAVRVLDPDVRADASLIAHTWGMEVHLVATGFDPGVPYRVTVADDAGRVVGAGEFVGTGEVQMRCDLNSSVLRVDAASFQVADPDGNVVLDATV